MTFREKFVERFGEAQAHAIELAAGGHRNPHQMGDDRGYGSDPFRWAVLVAISYECMSKDSYRKHHGITAPWDEVKPFIIEHGDLGNHDGDFDMLGAFCGAYDGFIPSAVAPEAEAAQ